VLVSKVGAEHDYEKDLVPAQRPQQLRAGVEANLHRLGVEQLTAVNLRRLDTGPGIEATGDQRVDLDSQLAEMVAMRDEGKIGGVGLSNVSLEQLRQALSAASCASRTPTTCSTGRARDYWTNAASRTWPGCRSSRSARPSLACPR